MDGGGFTQKRVRLRTRSPRMYTDVHSWACLRLICARASYLYRLFAKALEVGASTARRFWRSSTYQNAQGRAWFQITASFSLEKLVVEKRTWKYAFQQACGCYSLCVSYPVPLFSKALAVRGFLSLLRTNYSSTYQRYACILAAAEKRTS